MILWGGRVTQGQLQVVQYVLNNYGARVVSVLVTNISSPL